MIGHLDRERVPRGDRAELDQELGDVADLGHELLGRRLVAGREEVGVVLEHRPAAGGVDDDGVEAVGVEGGEVPAGEVERGPSDARVVMDRPAAALRRAGRRPRSRWPGGPGRSRRWSRGTSRRPRSPGTGRPAPASGRSAAGRPGAATPGPVRVGSIACIRRRVGGRSRVRPDPLGEVERPELLEEPGRRERGLDPAGEGEQVVEDQPLEHPGPVAGRGRGVEGDLERLDDLAVLDARGAGRSRRPGSRGRGRGACGPRPRRRAGRRRRPASGRSAPGGCRSRRRSRRRSGSSRCRARSGRSPGTGYRGSSRPARPGRRPARRGSKRGDSRSP